MFFKRVKAKIELTADGKGIILGEEKKGKFIKEFFIFSDPNGGSWENGDFKTNRLVISRIKDGRKFLITKPSHVRDEYQIYLAEGSIPIFITTMPSAKFETIYFLFSGFNRPGGLCRLSTSLQADDRSKILRTLRTVSRRVRMRR